MKALLPSAMLSALMFDPREYVGDLWNGRAVQPLGEPWYRFCRLLSEVERDIPIGPTTTWLDLGCHRGPLLRMLGQRHGIRSVGLDNWAQELPEGATWEYYAVDLDRDFGLGDRKFDVVSALEVLEHMIDTDAFLKRCRDQLKSRGYLLLTTPNINSLRNRLAVPLGHYPSGLEYRNEIHHVRLYNVPALVEHLGQHGFDVLWVRGVNALPMRVIAKMPEAVRPLADGLANRLPRLCGNVMALARRRD